MGKLPKELRQKRQRTKTLRTQSSPKSKTKKPVTKTMNRQMRRRMQQKGIEGMEEIDAQRVIIQTTEGNLVIEAPQIIKLKQQGMEVYQVIGSAQPLEEPIEIGNDSLSIDSEIVEDSPIPTNIEVLNPAAAAKSLPTFNVEITDQDVELVVMQTGVSKSEARKVLEEKGGDLAAAIIALKSK